MRRAFNSTEPKGTPVKRKRPVSSVMTVASVPTIEISAKAIAPAESRTVPVIVPRACAKAFTGAREIVERRNAADNTARAVIGLSNDAGTWHRQERTHPDV